MFDTTNTDRLNRLKPNFAVPDNLNNAKDRIEDAALGVAETFGNANLTVYRTIKSAFTTAFASICEYGSATLFSYGAAYDDASVALRTIADWFENPDPETALNHLLKASGKTVSAVFNGAVGAGLSFAPKAMFAAGLKAAVGAGALKAIAGTALPLVFILALGYAMLKVRKFMERDAKNLAAWAAQRLTGEALDFDEEDIEDEETYIHLLIDHIEEHGPAFLRDDDAEDGDITIEEVGDWDGSYDDNGDIECSECGEKFPAALVLAEHVATEHRDDGATDEDVADAVSDAEADA